MLNEIITASLISSTLILFGLLLGFSFIENTR